MYTKRFGSKFLGRFTQVCNTDPTPVNQEWLDLLDQLQETANINENVK